MGGLPLTVLVCEGAVSDTLFPSAWLSLCLLRGQPTCLGSLSPPRGVRYRSGWRTTVLSHSSPVLLLQIQELFGNDHFLCVLAISSLCSQSFVFSSSTSPLLLFRVRISPHDRALRWSQGHASKAIFLLLSEKPSRFLISSGPDCVIYLPPGQKLV